MDTGRHPARHHREHHPQAAPTAAHRRQPHPRRTPQGRSIQPAVPRPPPRRPRSTIGLTGTPGRSEPWSVKANRTTRRIPLAPRDRREHVNYVRAQETRGVRSLAVGKFDEGHLLGADQLEELRLLSNADLDSHTPFACLLVGQPTLRRRIKLGTFAALDRRIALRYAMNGMTDKETASYVAHNAEPAIMRRAAGRACPGSGKSLFRAGLVPHNRARWIDPFLSDTVSADGRGRS